ncbi:putative NAD(P)/FAD-binding protein YdhS [Rhodanobacter sp. ANJX3]|uniref:FAD/NAD(P)-binding protein n=1 Tax=unclassified Rhodanobacter TaxID=2621553 RepID=UPI0015CB6DA6|nr:MULTISPECIES: FAD/NAD(P)-binding protein [unclassified Rhodanobacter]MBB5360508.1 putative NAD(P)/FAD-binding protein YdhS [Rhodanobacter sp. ANJX3]NYE30292.1 putative NAD(P)/FAD-binding protein YdhS [Rhodanobacter sp. K2T2]
MFRRVAIIGGGAAAATLLSELLERKPSQPLHLDWYTGGGTLARGVAYGTASDRHLLNVRAASMSMFAGKPSGFLDFLQREDPTIAGTDFMPRRRYGDYLEAEVARALAQGKANGHDVNVIPFAVEAVVPERDAVTVMHGEESRLFDAAVLALGSLPTQPLSGVSAQALESGRYVVDPWALMANADKLPTPRKVVLIGLGLTAVDVLLELSARWPQTDFTAISRHGLLPEAHLNAAAAPTGDSGELIEAMRESPDVRHWLHLLREALAHERDWRAVLDSLRPHTPGLWRELDQEQRARFLRHARWAWERARHRMPPQVGRSIAALEGEGRLHRLRGRMKSVAVLGDNLQLQLASVPAGNPQTLDADLVIQTTGMNNDIRRTGHPLVGQLLTNGHVVSDPLGLGMQAMPDGRLARGEDYWSNLFAIGSMLRGTLWESTAMPEIRQQARSLADQLLAK